MLFFNRYVTRSPYIYLNKRSADGHAETEHRHIHGNQDKGDYGSHQKDEERHDDAVQLTDFMLQFGVEGVGLRKESAVESVCLLADTEKDKKPFAV